MITLSFVHLVSTQDFFTLFFFINVSLEEKFLAQGSNPQVRFQYSASVGLMIFYHFYMVN